MTTDPHQAVATPVADDPVAAKVVHPEPPCFLTALRCEQLDETRWKTLSTLSFLSVAAGTRIDVPTDYITDFASVPRLPIMWWLFGGVGHKAATVHDWLYQRHEIDGAPIAKGLADLVFLEALEAIGVWRWRAYPMYTAVAAFGFLPWRTGPSRFMSLNPKWALQEAAVGSIVPKRDVRVAETTPAPPTPDPP